MFFFIISLGRYVANWRAFWQKFISMAIDQNQIDELFAEDAFLSDIHIELTKSGNYISSTQLRLI
mgnify:CR=1 FL=1